MKIEGPTPAEEDVLVKTKELWNAIRQLDGVQNHPDDMNDLRFHIHAIQDLITARCVYRHYKGGK